MASGSVRVVGLAWTIRRVASIPSIPAWGYPKPGVGVLGLGHGDIGNDTGTVIAD